MSSVKFLKGSGMCRFLLSIVITTLICSCAVNKNSGTSRSVKATKRSIVSHAESFDFVKRTEVVNVDSSIILSSRIKESFKSYAVVKKFYAYRDSINELMVRFEDDGMSESDYNSKLKEYYDNSEELKERLNQLEEKLPKYPNDDSLGFVHFFNVNVIYENGTNAQGVQLIGFTNNQGEVYEDFIEISAEFNELRLRKYYP